VKDGHQRMLYYFFRVLYIYLFLISFYAAIIYYLFSFTYLWGTRWRSWLRHCATSRKVAGSIADGVTGAFHSHDPSGRTMALGLTQILTEKSTRNISWGVKAAGP